MGWEKGTYYSLVTPKLLPDYFQNNARLLSVYSLVIPRLLPGHFQTTPWWVPDYSLFTSSLLPCYSYTTLRLLLDYFLITPRLLPDYSQTTPWLLPDYSLVTPRLLWAKLLGQFKPDIFCHMSWVEKKGPVHSSAVQALAGSTISALNTHTAFTAIGW